jgi:hypothetical protein
VQKVRSIEVYFDRSSLYDADANSTDRKSIDRIYFRSIDSSGTQYVAETAEQIREKQRQNLECRIEDKQQ